MQSIGELRNSIEALWDGRDKLTPAAGAEARAAVDAALDALDAGRLRVAEP